MIKMNKLALCALLSVGVVCSAVGDDDVDRWLKENTVQIFDELGSLEACQDASKKVVTALTSEVNTQKRRDLWRLGGRLDSLCAFWEWFGRFDAAGLQSSDVERIFSEGISREGDIEEGKKLILLRDLDWGKGVKDKLNDTALKDKFEILEKKCEGFI